MAHVESVARRQTTNTCCVQGRGPDVGSSPTGVTSRNGFLRTYQQRANEFLSEYLPAVDQSSGNLHAAMRYAVFGNGKRLRPALVYATGEVLKIDPVWLDAMAGAVELIHAFSLVHDDLPAMDDNELRRGKLTTHAAYGEAVAILAGDALQIAAFHLLATDEQLCRQLYVQTQAIRMLTHASGSLGMTGGQALDLAAEGRALSASELESVYIKKTGKLIWASVAMPCAWQENIDPFCTQRIMLFGQRIGLAFQIRHDLLEFVSTEPEIDKSTQSVAVQNKATYPRLFGVAQARHRCEELYDEAMACLDAIGRDAEPLRWLANFVIRRKD